MTARRVTTARRETTDRAGTTIATGMAGATTPAVRNGIATTTAIGMAGATTPDAHRVTGTTTGAVTGATPVDRAATIPGDRHATATNGAMRRGVTNAGTAPNRGVPTATQAGRATTDHATHSIATTVLANGDRRTRPRSRMTLRRANSIRRSEASCARSLARQPGASPVIS
jgi:hypothetical protein